jgi:hydrogenase maturation factor
MKFVDEYRDGGIAAALAAQIAACASRPWVLMEVCGGQTHSIIRCRHRSSSFMARDARCASPASP